jgi:type VI secretion system secreted protein VgrG
MATQTGQQSSTANRRLGMQADFFFQAGPYTSDDLKVVRFQGIETISQPFLFHLDVVMEEAEPDFEGILGQSALLTIEGTEGTRYVNGIVSRFEQSGEPTRLTQYRAELVPKIWLLGLRHKSRIFQEMSVPDIVKKVLTEAGVPASEFQFKTKRNYPTREYCVQYRESELTFISRLMEEEGMYYWFEHSAKSHKMVIGDASSAHVPIDGDPKLIFHTITGEEPYFEHVYKFRYAQEVRPGEVVLRDFDFKKPKLDLTANKTADRDMNLQIYDYPGEYVQPSEGTALSEVRLQELQTSRKVGEGDSNCRRLLPGYKFTMDQHSRKDLNREYLLTRISHFGSQIQALKEAAGAASNEYRAQFSCIPADLQFRPARVTPRPAIYGSQTAIVTGPAGEEIYPDDHGRVKVQFHWDREGKRDEKSSCWIRVSQTWAGPSWGAIIIPRIGQEVVVQFLEGDPDRPIITGTVYNGDNRPPFPLPGGKSQAGFKSNSTLGGSGYNEFVMDDTKGKELIRIHGQYDKDATIEHDLREHVLNDRSRDVTNNETIKIGVDQTYSIGNNQAGSVGVNKSIQVGANQDETIGANMSINIGANLTENVGLNYAEKVGVAMELTVGAAMTQTIGAALVQSVGAAKAVDIGASSSESVGANKTVDVGGAQNVSVGKDDSLKVGKKLMIDAGDQIQIKTGSASITMKKDGTINIKGSKITIEGTQKIEEKAAQIKSEAQTKNEIKGAMITVEASGINTIKGALVKIN